MNTRNKFLGHRLAVLSTGFLISIGLLALFVPWLSPYTYDSQNIDATLQSASLSHWMGTDTLGRDVFTRIFVGARLSLIVGLASALVALVLGTLTGAWAGMRGGWIDVLLMRLVDFFYLFPSLLLAVLLMLALGRGVLGLLLALALTSWVMQARLVRAQVIQVREATFVESARAMGASEWRVFFSHILPQLWGPIIVSLTLQIPSNILAESFLSFIGLGIQPPFSSWGTLASEGFRALRSYPHLMIYPGVVLFLSMLAFNFLGDGLRDALDPKHPKQS